MTATARIVLVEDDPGVADLVTLYLRNAGFFVVRAATAADARRAFEEAKPALVVLDLGLPDGDGRDLFRELRAERDTPVLALTARAEEDEKIEALESGMDDYVTKPFDPRELVARVRAVLRRTSGIGGGGRVLTVGDLRLDLQAKLLRAIQEGEIERVGGTKPIKTEFRLIAATNLDLEQAVKEGRFREDLYYRLNVIPIKLPPLRERTEDISQLAEFFVRRYNARFRKKVQGITDSTMAMLKKYWWPGNIRELENLMERIVAVSDKDYVSDEDLPLEFHFAQLQPQGANSESLFEAASSAFERNFILRALEKCGWNVTGTAEYLGVPLSTLKYKMDKLDVRQLAKRLRGA